MTLGEKIRDVFALAKFRFDIGVSFITLINFALLIIVASEKIQTIWPISTLQLGLILVPLVFFGTWLFGYFLDRVVKYQKSYYKQQFIRVPQIAETYKMVDEINKKIDRMEAKQNEEEKDK